MDPSSAISFTHLLRERAEKTPGKVAVRYLADLGARIDEATYAQLDAHARAIAVELLQHCAPGDRAVLLYPPGIDYVYALLGCFYAGVIAVPAYPPEPRRLARTLPRLRALVANADAPVIMTDAMLFALAGGLAELAPELAAKKWLVPSLSAQSAPSDAWRMPALRHDQVAFLQYTSGSTGQPKGAVISHGNVLANCRQNRAATEATEESTWVSWLPLYHDLGLIAHLLVSLYSGATVVLLSPLDFLRQPALWLRAIDKYRGDISGAPNFAFDVCAAKIKPEEVSGLDLGCWRVAFNAAEPVRADTVERFARAFAPAKLRRESLYIAYGLAEATVLVSRTVFGSPVRVLSLDAAALEESRIVPATGTTPARNLVSAGVAVDQEVIVVGPSGSELAEGQVGELWIPG